MPVKFRDTININDSYTFPSADGTADQAIITDGAGTLSFSAVSDGQTVKIECKNASGSTITKGTPVYITGTVGSSFRVEVAPADASNSAKMPAVGF
jgi:DNA/RNA endonuclease YhcR with UshA esterase domain